ncbi:hypothetical protein ACQ4PT_057156 [Festuca glaucescens]
MDVYDFSLASDQYSLALVHIFNPGDGAVTSMNSIQIGWENDGYQNTHCLNTACPGFQPEAGAAIFLGDVIEPVSQPNGVKQNITIKVLKVDRASGDWLVHYGFNQHEPTLIGRYPKSLFTGGLAERASDITIGGAVMTPRSTDLVPMGSGYLPSTTVAAAFSNFQIIDQNGQASLVNQNLPVHVTQPGMYSVTPVINGQFFYGGPFQPPT